MNQSYRKIILVFFQASILQPFDDGHAARLYRMMITPAQCRGARGLLKWNQKELAAKSGISSLAINRFERGRSSPHHATLKVLKETFEEAGVAFIERDEGVGVMLRTSSERAADAS